MRFELQISVTGILLLGGLAASAAATDSAVVDMTHQSGPSRFVTDPDGKPAQLGIPAPGRSTETTSDDSGPVTVVAPSQSDMEPGPPLDQPDRRGGGDKQARGKAGTDPADFDDDDDEPEGGDAAAPEGGSCDVDCDDE